MRTVLTYFRQHPWQWRTMTILLAGLIGLLAAYLFYPSIRAYRVVSALTDGKPAERDAAIERATRLARQDPLVVAALNKALVPKANDFAFEAIAKALQDAKLFYVPDRPTWQIDRLQRLGFERRYPVQATTSTAPATQPAKDEEDGEAASRRDVVWHFVLANSPGKDTDRLLTLASLDSAPSVRREAALLAALVNSAPAIDRLLLDQNPAVRAAMVLDLGLAGRAQYGPRVAEFLRSSDALEAANAAYALACLQPSQWSPAIAERIRITPPGALRDKLLWVATLLPPQVVGPAVLEALQAPAEAAENPDRTMPILAAGALKLDAASPILLAKLKVIDVPDALRRREELTAAVWACRQINTPAAMELDTLMRTAYSPQLERLMIESALSLAQAVLSANPGTTSVPTAPAGTQGESTRQHAIQTLIAATSRTDAPVAGAAAALALWQLEPRSGELAIIQAAQASEWLPGEWLAWRLSRLDPATAERVAMELLNVRYNDDARAGGAMMLALADRDTLRAPTALGTLADRFGPPEAPASRNGILNETYRCAVLLLGQRQYQANTETLLAGGEFPQRRLMTALLLSGSRRGADWLLANPQLSPADLDYLLGGKTIGEVLQLAQPTLPHYEPLATPPVRLWQAQILQDAYVLNPRKK